MLYPHQEKALKETEQFNRVAYYLDMGLGKTFVGTEKMVDLHKRTNLLVCQKSKIEDWIEHFQKYTRMVVLDLTDKNEMNDFLHYDASAYAEVDYYRPYVGVINYDLIFRRPELLKLTDFTLMLDESSIITNPTTKRTKAVLKMQPDNVILLSGTPTGGKYEKLWSQLKLLGWNISKDLFYKQYVITDWIEDDAGFRQEIIIGYKNVDRLKLKLRQYGCIFMKTEEVFDLPEKTMIPIKVSNCKEYRYFMRNSIVEMPDGSEIIADRTLTKRLYARQLCGQYSSAKLKAFEDLMQSTDDRLIVFYNFNEELRLLTDLAEKLEKPISVVNGDIKDLKSYNDEPNSVTFLQYQAGAMGLNLQKANKIVYFTLPQASDLFEQSQKRIHRIGQTNQCFYYLLMVKNSIEEDILNTLKMRKDYDDELFKIYEQTQI